MTETKPKCFEIAGLCDLNRYIDAERANKHAGAKIKRQETNFVAWACKAAKIGALKEPIFIRFTWVEENNRMDPDNIAFAKKFVLDGMVQAGCLKNDGRKNVVGFEDNFANGPKRAVVLEIYEEVNHERRQDIPGRTGQDQNV